MQRGAHNYAGPNCPGKGWTCTTAKRVLQISSDDNKSGRGRDDGGGGDDNQGGGGGDGDNNNTFVCASNSGPGSSSGPGDCRIFQFSTSGDNIARCFERSGDPLATQSCRIVQNNTTGNNWIVMGQKVDTNDGPTQLSSQYAGSRQINGTGSNYVRISQDIQQSLKKRDSDPSGTQKQDGHQGASVTQTSDTGDNTARVDQSLALQADAKKGTTLSQLQNTDGNVNSNVGVVQFSFNATNGGHNVARVNQSNNYDAHIGKADVGNQQQGSPGGGENVFFLQNSTGVSTIQANQREHQDLHAEHVGSLTQTQYGPQWADPEQGSNPADSYNINQTSDQFASNPNTQNDQQFAQCHTSGNCTANEHVRQQGRTQDNSCSGSSCDIGNHFITQGGESSQGSCTSNSDNQFSCASEGTPSPPPTPPGD